MSRVENLLSKGVMSLLIIWGVASVCALYVINEITGEIAAWHSLGLVFCFGISAASATLLIKSLLNDRSRSTREIEAHQQKLESVDDLLFMEVEKNVALERQIFNIKNGLENTRARERFLATVSHEIRTPLNGLLGMLSLLQRTDLSLDQKQYLKSATQSGDLLLTLINDVLDYSKMEAGKLTLNETTRKLEELIHSISEPMANKAFDKEVEFAIHIDPLLPDKVTFDHERLKQVLLNLLGNAIRYTDTGGITLACLRSSNGIKFIVEDTGRGIPSSDFERIFMPFQQRDEMNRSDLQGTGLGLSIASQLVRVMGGALSVESAVNEGSRFEFSLPLKNTSVNGVGEVAPSEVSNKRILVGIPIGVERKSLEFILRNQGYEPTFANELASFEAKLAAASAASLPFDCALCDSRLLEVKTPDQRLATLIRVHDTPITLIIRPEERNWVFNTKNLGIAGYLLRPLRHQAVEVCLAKMLEPSDSIGKTNFFTDPVDEIVKPERSPVKQGEPLRVLLAEDNQINELLIRSLLERENCDVHSVDNGDDALSAYQKGSFHLLMTDVHMPKRDGVSMIRAIRRFEQDEGIGAVPIVALTADVTDECKMTVTAAGANIVLHKPINIDVLGKLVADCRTEYDKQMETDFATVEARLAV